MLDKTTLQGMVATNGAVDTVRYKKSGTFGSHGQPTFSVGGHDRTSHPGKGRGIPCALVAMLATRENIDATMGDQRLSHDPVDLLQCYASDLRVPRNYKEAMRSEGKKLLDAGTVEPVYYCLLYTSPSPRD